MGTYAAHATARGVQLDDLEVGLEATIDLNGSCSSDQRDPAAKAYEPSFGCHLMHPTHNSRSFSR